MEQVTPRKGDKIRVTAEGSVRDVSGDLLWVTEMGGWFDASRFTIEIIESADDPARDLIGTVRKESSPHRLPIVKADDDLWHVIGNSVTALGDRHDVVRRSPVIGTVPGSPAADAAEAQAEPEVITADSPEPDRSRRYTDRDGDEWFWGEHDHHTNIAGWGYSIGSYTWHDVTTDLDSYFPWREKV